MIIVNILGGMGNQLRAYASAYVIARYLNQPMMLDIADYHAGYFRPYVLDRLNIPAHDKLSYARTSAQYHTPYGMPHEVLQDFLQEPADVINIDKIGSREELLARIKGKENIYVYGYGGTKYCTEAEKAELRNIFQPYNESEALLAFKSSISGQNSVAVHVRRTDFIAEKWFTEFSLYYYQAAISYINEHIESPEFYFFSDDIEWCKENLGNQQNFHYVKIIGGMEKDVDELFCMAACKHRILANMSTFSAWAAFLSPHQDGLNILNNPKNMEEVPDYILLDNQKVIELAAGYICRYDNIVKPKLLDFMQLEELLISGHNEEVIKLIAQNSVNMYYYNKEQQNQLLEYKGIAAFQAGDINLALSVYDSLQQFNRDKDDFVYNYALALMQAVQKGVDSITESDNNLDETESNIDETESNIDANADFIETGNNIRINEKYLESILYAATYAKNTGDISILDYFPQFNEFEKSACEIVLNSPYRHYVFFITKWGNVRGYYESIAIVLRNLGNRVTFLELAENGILIDANEQQAISMMKQSGCRLDSVYNYDIDKYSVYWIDNGGLVSVISQFLKQITGENEEIIYITHTKEGLLGASKDYQVIFLDKHSKWDVQNVTESYSSQDWEMIYEVADKVVTDKRRSEDASYYTFSERLSCTSHFMRNEESLCGALAVLQAALK